MTDFNKNKFFSFGYHRTVFINLVVSLKHPRLRFQPLSQTELDKDLISRDVRRTHTAIYYWSWSCDLESKLYDKQIIIILKKILLLNGKYKKYLRKRNKEK